MKILYVLILSYFITGCYSFNQSIDQFKLLLKQQELFLAIQNNLSNKDLLEKLQLVKPILIFTEKYLHLTPKNSYQKYIQLNTPYVSWVVQAAEKRRLKLKTWWFPFIGIQPYLGFFNKQEALKQKQSLMEENYDVSIGGVKAFSLLGYYPDPLYSSMLEKTSTSTFIETLIHEIVHRTIYIKDNYSFNENLANFIARKATILFLKQHPEISVNIDEYVNKFQKLESLQNKFNIFVNSTKSELDSFYNSLNIDNNYKNDVDFFKARDIKFNEIIEKYRQFMNGEEKGTYYEHVFVKDLFNNAVLLSYSVYEQEQSELEKIYLKSNSSLPKMVDSLQMCFSKHPATANAVWRSLSFCF
jgi:predicted aminopeptidase